MKIKKLSAITLSCILLFAFPLSVQASGQPPQFNASGYTDDAIWYEVQGSDYTQLTANSIFVTRKVTYGGIVAPPRQISWQEKINNITYSGTLRIISYIYDGKAQQTIATYEGTLTAK